MKPTERDDLYIIAYTRDAFEKPDTNQCGTEDNALSNAESMAMDGLTAKVYRLVHIFTPGKPNIEDVP